MSTYGPDSVSAENGARTQPVKGAGVGNIHTATDGRDLLFNEPDGWEVERPWLWWDGPAGGDGTGGPFGNPPPGAFNGPKSWSALPVFMQCTSLIADQIAAMPWQVYRDGTKLSVPSWIEDPQAARLDGRVPSIDVPLVRMNQAEFWSQVITSLLWHGEAFVYTPRNEAGQIIAPLWLLHPDDVEVAEGRYYVNGLDDGADREYLEEAELIVIRGHVRPGDQRGFGVLDAFREPLRLAAQVRGYALNVFTSGVPAGYLKVNQPDLTPERARNLQKAWMASHGGVMKKIAVLNAVTEFHPLSVDPQTMALIDMLKITAWEICTMFGVPTSKVGLSLADSMTYNNAQDDDARFVKDTLTVWVDRIETALSNRLPAQQYMKVNLNSYLRANTTERFASYAVALDPQTGWMTQNEVRDLEDLAPLPEVVAANAEDGDALDPAISLAFDLVKGAPSLANAPGIAALVEQIRQVLSGETAEEPAAVDDETEPADEQPDTEPADDVGASTTTEGNEP
jgi:HK97 family phage portal protein